jgi:hypothetical protein
MIMMYAIIEPLLIVTYSPYTGAQDISLLETMPDVHGGQEPSMRMLGKT